VWLNCNLVYVTINGCRCVCVCVCNVCRVCGVCVCVVCVCVCVKLLGKCGGSKSVVKL